MRWNLDCRWRSAWATCSMRTICLPQPRKIVLVNGHYIAPEARASCRLNEGDHLAVWPPIAGG